MSPLTRGAELHEHSDRRWRTPEQKRSYDVAIVGDGGHGLAPAHDAATSYV